MPLNKTEPTIIIFSGYARSGKTTTMIPALTEMGFRVFSASEALHVFCDNLFQTLFNTVPGDIDTKNKDSIALNFIVNIDFVSRSKTYRLIRTLLIDIAENCLVKVFGRQIFSGYLLKELRGALKNGSKVAIETIGGEEFDLFYNQLTKEEKTKVLLLNVRRKNEEKGVDIRQLLKNGFNVYNDTSREEFNLKLRKIVQEKSVQKFKSLS